MAEREVKQFRREQEVIERRIEKYNFKQLLKKEEERKKKEAEEEAVRQAEEEKVMAAKSAEERVAKEKEDMRLRLEVPPCSSSFLSPFPSCCLF